MKLPAIKKYDIDYEFLVKNYLDPSLWEKKWTLLEYKTFVISLSLYSIECESNSILFKLSYEDGEFEYKGCDAFKYNVKSSSILFLKKSIKGKIIRAIYFIETNRLKETDAYLDIQSKYSNERQLLTEIANDFLDEEGVRNNDIRNSYICDYVYNNEQLDSKLNAYIHANEYTIIPDFYLLIANIYNDTTLENDVINALNSERVKEVLDDVQELYEYMQTEEYEGEMRDGLDGI